MEEFQLPVTYKGQEQLFNVKLATFTYGYKFYVDVNGHEVVFERDDEGNMRAMIQDLSSDSNVEKGLIEAIMEVFTAL
ncbi:Uncharacterised protein [Chryseobacterium nakagawai]|uniref:Uncharacterized protein n=1 Tax=Chryseobacterium nakagawai TaxID=1241982 RepID=A0AAD0YIN7_CHRNA|nr:hypothetical protein [Chryseobacterium nakagawai]AZA89199.1 hypothetical protein EG343_00405 [Chryseobacterium nakagawai]VEH20527.1 Uncharacterised protein [Chryseobacterium nakagawai]